MRPYIIIVLILFACRLFAQTSYKISYNNPTTLRVNIERLEGKEKFYDVDFLNKQNQKIKSLVRTQIENHESKVGYDIEQSISYYFYKDSLLIKEISINPIYKRLYKTEYTYNKNNKSLGWISYSIKPKISIDSFQRIINSDFFLNNPNLFPSEGLTVETKQIKQYNDDKLIYKCYYERYGKLKTAVAAREQFFKYNNQEQLIEHISNPKSEAGGTAFLRQIFEYNNQNLLIKREWYENEKHQATDEFEYKDNVIIETSKFYDIYGNGNPSNFSVMTTTFKMQNDGKFYDEKFNRKFSVCSDME